MKRKVIFQKAGENLGCAMINTLPISPIGVYGMAVVDGRKLAITKDGENYVVKLR